MLEKSWGKINGGYLNTQGGLCQEVLTAFTGAPVFTHFTDDDDDENWEVLVTA